MPLSNVQSSVPLFSGAVDGVAGCLKEVFQIRVVSIPAHLCLASLRSTVPLLQHVGTLTSSLVSISPTVNAPVGQSGVGFSSDPMSGPPADDRHIVGPGDRDRHVLGLAGGGPSLVGADGKSESTSRRGQVVERFASAIERPRERVAVLGAVDP